MISLDVSHSDTNNINLKDMSLMLKVFVNFRFVDLLSFDTSKVKDMSNIFYNFDEAHETNIKIYFKI
jgi:hypothetical protein